MHCYASVRTEAAYRTHELDSLHFPAILHFEKIGDRLGIRVSPLERTERRALAIAGRSGAPHGDGELWIGAIAEFMRERSTENPGWTVSITDLSCKRKRVIGEDRLIDVESSRIVSGLTESIRTRAGDEGHARFQCAIFLTL